MELAGDGGLLCGFLLLQYDRKDGMRTGGYSVHLCRAGGSAKRPLGEKRQQFLRIVAAFFTHTAPVNVACNVLSNGHFDGRVGWLQRHAASSLVGGCLLL